MLSNTRLCVACRKASDQKALIRLTFDTSTSALALNCWQSGKKGLSGRSAYLCPSTQCVNRAINSLRLKNALTGRMRKPSSGKRQISWPLESQLIKDILTICTEQEKTCQNTRVKEA